MLNSPASLLPRRCSALRPRRTPASPAVTSLSIPHIHQQTRFRTTTLGDRSTPLNEPLNEKAVLDRKAYEQESLRQRWAYTPKRMKGAHGFSLNAAKKPDRPERNWKVNEDTSKLVEFYERFLGEQGAKLLSEELKWLAITHKSFDYGRRGYNTRLAYFGRQILTMEAIQWIMTSPTDVYNDMAAQDSFGREPYRNAAVENVDKLGIRYPQEMLMKDKMARVAVQCRLQDVVRWEPRKTQDLRNSGQETVLTTALFAIIGAISLQHGSEVASRVARDRVLRKVHTQETKAEDVL